MTNLLPAIAAASAILLMAAAGAAARAPSGRRGDAKVAVLVEPGMVACGGTPGVPPGKIAALLKRHGLRADELDVADITGGELEPARYPVLVVAYGNAFPLPAFPALCAYHAKGGCLVLNGVPFCHPCEREGGKWVDRGHIDYFGHGERGIGTGGFGGSHEERELRIAGAGGGLDPLSLAGEVALPRDRAKTQWLEPRRLSGEDEVIPLVESPKPGEARPRVVSAVIRHGCGEFRGAIDVWLGRMAEKSTEGDAYFASQIYVRGAAYCLRGKGRITKREHDAVLASVRKMEKPTPPPSDLPYRPEPRPWGDTYLPRSAPPERRLVYVDLGGRKREERIALGCLQGLTSRTQPRIWLGEKKWLDRHVEMRHVDGYETVKGEWAELFARFAEAYKGAVIYDRDLYRGDLVALNVAACEDLIALTPEVAKRLRVPVRIDLRGRFDNYADAMRWVWKTYRRKLNRHLCNFIHPGKLGTCAFAYDLQWRGVMFWYPGKVDASEPGADPVRDQRVVAETMAEMAPNVAVLGFPYAGEGVGPGEPPGVKLASSYAKALVCTDFLSNTSVMSGVRVPRFRQKRAPPAPPLERDKVYIALVLSDGDNQNTWRGFMKHYFEHPRHGEIPLAFGMGPPIADLQPGVAQWYYEHAAPTTEFICDVSGVGYIQPENYGTRFADREAVFDGFLDWTKRYLEIMDMHSLRTVGGEDDLLRRYATKLPGMHSLFADMGRWGERKKISELTYALGRMPVFRAVTSWRYKEEGFLREVREVVGDARPAFVNGFVHCWTWKNLGLVGEIYDKRDADMVFVTPSQLAELYKQARRRGWAK
ncbi:MAG: hypothetical protein ACYS9X_21960 [Planctomycetota bacterium]